MEQQQALMESISPTGQVADYNFTRYIIATNQTQYTSSIETAPSSGGSQWMKSKGDELKETNWVYWTVVGAGVCGIVIVLIVLYDIFCRCRDTLVQAVFDGGPPVTPTHQMVYPVAIKGDQASSSFDSRQSVLKFELLDGMNRYLSTIAVPVFLIKVRQDSEFSTVSHKDGKSKESQSSKQLPIQLKQEMFELRQNIEKGDLYRSMTDLHEIWSNSAARSSPLAFRYIRRTPLFNFSAIRVTHDCWARDATIKLKYFVLYDELKNVYYRADLQGFPIRAIHVCPPTRLQVFQVERLSSGNEMPNELKKLSMNAKNNRFFACCPF